MKTSATPLIAAVAALAFRETAAGIIYNRQTDEWTAPDGGNVYVEIGDNKIRWGTALPSSAFDVLLEQCADLGCQSTSYYLPTKRESNQFCTQDGQVVEMKVQGSFAPSGQSGSKEDLINIAKQVMFTAYDEGVHTFESDVVCATDTCNNPRLCPFPESTTLTQWTATDHLIVQYEQPDGTSYDINVTFISGGGDGGGICSALLGFGAALAGVLPSVGAVAGGAFSLAALGCA